MKGELKMAFIKVHEGTQPTTEVAIPADSIIRVETSNVNRSRIYINNGRSIEILECWESVDEILELINEVPS